MDGRRVVPDTPDSPVFPEIIDWSRDNTRTPGFVCPNPQFLRLGQGPLTTVMLKRFFSIDMWDSEFKESSFLLYYNGWSISRKVLTISEEIKLET